MLNSDLNQVYIQKNMADYLQKQMALPNNLMFQIFSSYHFDAIVLEREFPMDLYPWRNETDVSSTQGTAAKSYDFLNSNR